MEAIKFFVPGVPVPQGSKNAFVMRGKAVMSEANKNTKPWRDTIKAIALDNYKGIALLCPLKVNVCFFFQRPNSHLRKNGTLKPNQPNYKPQKPDLDKLLRSLGDSLTGIIWYDDSQIVQIFAKKLFFHQIEAPLFPP